MSTPREALTFPGLRAVDKARMAAFVARCSTIKDHAPLDDEPLEHVGPPHRGRPAVGATSSGRCSTPSSTAPTTTCPRPTCGRARAAPSGTRDRAGREVMGWIRGGHQALADRSRTRSATLGGEVLTSHPGPLHPVAATGARTASCSTPASVRHDWSSRRCCGRTWSTCSPPTSRRRCRPDPCRYLGHRLPRRARAQERQPVLRAEHHRPADPAHERGRDDARRRSRARAAAT